MSLPGTRMRALAARVCSATTMDRLVDPVVADLQVEYRQAVRESRPWKGRWTLLVGYLTFGKVMLLCGIFGTRQAWRRWNVEDQRAFNRTLLWIAVATVVSSVVVGLPGDERLR